MEYLALGAAVFLGGVVSGFSGFAFSAVAGAILLHVYPPLQAIPLMMLCSIISQSTSLTMLRKHVVWKEIGPLFLGGVVGVPIALALVLLVDATAFRVAFGIFLATYAAYMLTRPAVTIRFADRPAVSSAVGFAGGLVGGLTAMPGALPVIWCELRGISKERQRGVVQPFILAMQIFAVTLFLLSPGVANRELFVSLALALPALAVGTLVGMALFGRVDDRKFRIAVLVLVLVSGCLMVR